MSHSTCFIWFIYWLKAWLFLFFCNKAAYCALNLQKHWLTPSICSLLSLLSFFASIHPSFSPLVLSLLHPLVCLFFPLWLLSISLSLSLSAGYVHVSEKGKPHACSARWCLLLRYLPRRGLNTHTYTHEYLYICFYYCMWFHSLCVCSWSIDILVI